MLYTAAIMWCLIDKPQNYDNCQVMNGPIKLVNEDQCWLAVNAQLQVMGKIEGYEVVDAKCIQWIKPKDPKI
jgi:hypothetical protein